MNVANTSRNHFKKYDASSWYIRIKEVMFKDEKQFWCIADMAHELDAEKSTISARFNELVEYGEIELEGTFRSRTTDIKSKHYKLVGVSAEEMKPIVI